MKADSEQRTFGTTLKRQIRDNCIGKFGTILNSEQRPKRADSEQCPFGTTHMQSDSEQRTFGTTHFVTNGFRNKNVSEG